MYSAEVSPALGVLPQFLEPLKPLNLFLQLRVASISVFVE
jgi:hypothetical protein